MSKRRLLWWSDLCITSGFARVGHSILDRLHTRWDVAGLGTLYSGDPHPYPYRIYSPIRTDGGYSDVIGVGKITEVINAERPHVICAVQDPWIVADFIKTLEPHGLDLRHFVAYMPVDAPNAQPEVAKELSRLACAVFYTNFGAQEYIKAGLATQIAVIPHGVDTQRYRPIPKQVARAQAGFPEAFQDAFIVGSFHRNQPRKRLDLALEYFAAWVNEAGLPPNVCLYMHCAAQDPAGIDIRQYAEYLGIPSRVLLSSHLVPTQGVPEEHLALLYNSMDVHITTSGAEGWNLPLAESMACGVPNIAGDSGGQGEWADGGCILVPCSSKWVLAQVNTVHAFPDKEPFINSLNALYESVEVRDKWRRAGLALVNQKRFRWESVANQFHQVLSDAAKP